ncbi:MAG TPA: RluA family pseudouridine synthase [Candidatus Krumholzibacteria bacterium]|nr:RluA family pseudouridine synthase [Candidatus Krumholzibacteria bacterium]HPD72418.1 RluA family pseudouridine synthase [Candidatus Krumholzibacteria bacterium]HRY40650.1 RluA family pseudouridine synthase [Candidatus Krumholzibacteria bacterium]
MTTGALQILFEDNHLLAVVKPANLLVQGDSTGDPTLLEAARTYLKAEYAKPGNVYLGLVHRLDRPVSGVVLFARTSKAAARLSRQFREGTVRKIYLAVVEGGCEPPAGELVHYLASTGDARGVTRAALAAFPGSKLARLRYHVTDRAADRSRLEIELITGRRHQIRAQLALAGWPVWGDAKYGARPRASTAGIGLHAWRLGVVHPVSGEPVVLEASPPAEWPWPAT